MENYVAIFTRTKYAHTLYHSYVFLSNTLNRNAYTCALKDMEKNVLLMSCNIPVGKYTNLSRMGK